MTTNSQATSPVADDEFLHMMAVGEEFLEHHGVKGMKWGVRKAQVAGAASATGRGIKKAGIKTAKIADNVHFEVKGQSDATTRKIVNGASKEFRAKDLGRINAKPQYVQASKVGHRLKNPKDPATKAYREEVKRAYILRLEKQANSMTNMQGSRRYTIKEYNDQGQLRLPKSKYNWSVHTEHINHAAGDDFSLDVLLDAEGFVTDVVPSTGGTIAHAAAAPAKSAPKTLKVSPNDHPVTKKVKQDHNNLSDEAFKAKYKVSKKTYQMRIGQAPNGDPFVAAQKK